MHYTIKNLLPLLLLFICTQQSIAQESSLSVEKIMQDPDWMGTFPSNVKWSEDSKTIYFNYNLAKDPDDSLYKISLAEQGKILKVPFKEESKIPSRGDYNNSKTLKAFTKNGELMLYDRKANSTRKVLSLGSNISNPEFLKDNNRLSFIMEDNIYIYHLDNGSIEKLTNIEKKDKTTKEKSLSAKDEWLQEDNLSLLSIVKERKERKEGSKAYTESTTKKPYTFYTEDRSIANLDIAPNAEFVTFNLITREDDKKTIVPDYTDASGYTVDLPARSKVGNDFTKVELAIYDLKKDTVYMVNTESLPGIQDLPDYTKDYPDKNWEKKNRAVIPWGVFFSEDGKNAILDIRSHDNKDRWITLMNLQNGDLKTLDRQRDDAWIAGPGIGGYSFTSGTLGWLPDNEHIYFQSEESGYSHLYLLNINTGKKKALTKGEFEVFDPFLSNDKKHWYLTTSEIHPGERHFYKMPLMGGKMVKLTTMTGNNEVSLSPDEKHMAILYSYKNKPWELYLKETSIEAKAKQLTSGQTKEFKSYNWKEPELVNFKAEDGAMVPARLYKPTTEANNGTAVIFVHGAGYLQNAHKWWSSYFREYMFHNLLSDLGYTVLDIDYRGSAGYGRDWRTGIYRHMGGKDLSDQVDGAKYLVESHNVDPENIGIYGGSYGGFITLMAMFNENDTFKAGAALRSVTDWAHYNDGYTSNILNTPTQDPIAYKRSSPIYFAEGLKGDLLIAHGMLDINVHFQDVVRLAQRLIELEKDDWEMAVYPVEGHGFIEPSSWTDEYSRILKLFNETLLKK